MTAISETSAQSTPGWTERTLGRKVNIDLEVLAYIILILMAILTRFYDLETRVMSHDESLHTMFSWYLSEGRGFNHDPLMHGPLQMHLISLSYFLFGDSDASARIPVAAAGVLAVGLVFLFRRWIGKWGAITATLLMVISPYMLYYSRYVRNEGLVVPLALLMFYAVFRYYETRQARWLYLLAASLALHFAAKETAFIYTLQLWIFLGLFLAWRLLNEKWKRTSHLISFIIGTLATVIGGLVAIIVLLRERAAGAEQVAATGLQPDPNLSTTLEAVSFSPIVSLGFLLALLGFVLILISLVLSFGRRLRTDFPTLDILVISFTMTIPQLAAIPAKLLGWDPLEYQNPALISRTSIVVAVLFLISLAIGAAWNWRKWSIAAGIFFGLFIIFFTTLFNNSDGVGTGLVGSLGYWLEQQNVERGGQPWYYYLFIQIPIYEYLPAIGALLAAGYGLRKGSFRRSRLEGVNEGVNTSPERFPAVGFFGYWSVTSIVLYSFAGERMPWLTVHIALPLIMIGGWGIGKLLGSVDWRDIRKRQGWLIPILLILILITFLRALGSVLGDTPPFQGNSLDQLRATNGFMTASIVGVGALIAVVRVAKGWTLRDLMLVSSVLALGGLALLNARAAFRAAYINYDDATEYLVYAHGATGVKTVMDQVEEFSVRTTDGLGVKVAFDDDVSWPMNWYLRNYTGQFFFGPNPTRELLNYPIVIVGDNNWSLVEPLFKDNFYSFEYIRMWWPNQDYWSLKWSNIENERLRDVEPGGPPLEELRVGEYLTRVWDHIKPFFTDSQVREAVWQIWLNRDFTLYGQLTSKNMNLSDWSPSDRMRMYIRKDVAAQIWDYGVSPVTISPEPFVDPYADGLIDLESDFIVGQEGQLPGQFLTPRSMAFASDGMMYIADSGNHRIQHISPEGEILTAWGSHANVSEGNAPGGTFNEPWGVAVAPDGTVYVADTWNHRIQYFTPQGEFLGMFGEEGQAGSEDIFWGPRDVAVDSEGHVLVSDTGNKRVVVFTADGQFITQFGGGGYLPGKLDEPVGIAIGPQGQIYVADTWNQRIQVFEEFQPQSYSESAEWEVDAWFGQSLDSKPYLSVGAQGQVCTSDPEGYRILCFTPDGQFLVGWGGPGTSALEFGVTNGVAFDPQGRLWVVDSGNSRLMRFSPDLADEG